ncbi:MAG: hypothetical protein E6Q39_01790 [Crocinitomicaceae bacterium]|jgi:hypothetical protein|nr:MAG: hypothetical protein E6Q39_01790 [Crocinitomicaceae bacterium]
MTVNEKIDYLFSKINWGASCLDAKAIEIMNNLKTDISSIEDDCFDANERLQEGRTYLMGVESHEITVENALQSFGFGRNGLN